MIGIIIRQVKALWVRLFFRGDKVDLLISVFLAVVCFKLLRALVRRANPRRECDVAKGRICAAEFCDGTVTRWINSNEEFRVKGVLLKGGLFYLGTKLPGADGKNDCSLIDPTLPSGPEGLEKNGKEDFKPGYSLMSPQERNAYLRWIENGRTDKGPCFLPYATLFLFGLERRLSVDGASGKLSASERDEILTELQRLLDSYGDDPVFRGAVMNIIALEWAIYGNYDDVPPHINFEEGAAADSFAAVLAWFSICGKPVLADWALKWVILREPEAPPGGHKRKNEEFAGLFKTRYEEKFGKGMILHPSRKPLIIQYRPSNPSLGERRMILIPRLTDPFQISTPLHKIDGLAGMCEAELAKKDGGIS
jgi:hypothetical protein